MRILAEENEMRLELLHLQFLSSANPNKTLRRFVYSSVHHPKAGCARVDMSARVLPVRLALVNIPLGLDLVGRINIVLETPLEG